MFIHLLVVSLIDAPLNPSLLKSIDGYPIYRWLEYIYIYMCVCVYIDAPFVDGYPIYIYCVYIYIFIYLSSCTSIVSRPNLLLCVVGLSGRG